MKYLVMEVHAAYCVVMDDRGKLYRVANMNYQLGQSIDDVVLMEQVKTKAPFTLAKYFTFPRLALATSLAFVCVFGFISIFNQPFTAYAQVYLTVNPQVKISVDKQNRVGNIEALNPDGAKLIFEYKYKNKELTQVLDQLLDRALEYGMLKQDGQVSIDIDTDDEKWFQDSGILLRDNLNQYLQDKITVTIKIQNYHDVNNDTDDINKPDDDYQDNNDDNDEIDDKTIDDFDDDDSESNNQSNIHHISSEQALTLALNHAGVDRNYTTILQNDFDCEQDSHEDCKYEIEFEINGIKYIYEINAINSSIMSFDKEIED